MAKSSKPLSDDLEDPELDPMAAETQPVADEQLPVAAEPAASEPTPQEPVTGPSGATPPPDPTPPPTPPADAPAAPAGDGGAPGEAQPAFPEPGTVLVDWEETNAEWDDQAKTLKRIERRLVAREAGARDWEYRPLENA
jgi:hypothetical protein